MSPRKPPQKKPKKASTAEVLFKAPVAHLTTPTQDNAIQLHELGFNVFPVPHAKKGGWPWRQFQYTRVHPKHLLPLFEGRCNLAIMTGRTSHNLFVIDCETEAAFRAQGQKLCQANIPIWSVRSGGGGHYYLRCTEGEVANIHNHQLKDIEIRGNRCYVLAPPSVHPDTGVIYQWGEREGNIPPEVSLAAIDWLPLKLATHAKRDNQYMPTVFPELSAQTRDFIVNGAPEGKRNNRLFAAACDMAGNNYDDYTIRQILRPVAIACGLPSRETEDTLKSALSRDREPAKKSQTPEKPKHWQKAVAWAKQQPWQGRTGQTDRAVFLACCERARLASNENGVFRASVREVAELARITKETASRSLMDK